MKCRQLRRLQSRVAAIKGAKQSPEAITYRLELWTCILHSPGFKGGFQHWWTSHSGLASTPAPRQLPSAPPGHEKAEQIFHAFKMVFEQLESWHLRQRSTLPKCKYDKGMNGLYQNVRRQPRDRLDFFHKTHPYGVLAVKHHQAHLDWSHDGVPFAPETVNEVFIDTGHVCEVGNVLEQHQTIADIPTLQSQLLEYWKPIWCATEEVDPGDWQRILNFFMPSCQSSPLICLVSQLHSGVDGISHHDLLALPDAWTEQLLHLLHRIEKGSFLGLSAIAKDAQASTVDRFKPIVIFWTIYRTWASLRSRQLLRAPAPHVACEAYGFLPGRDASQLWTLLQGEIECSPQGDQPLCGLSTDLIRAFNNIPRQHTFALARNLGVPNKVTGPWKRF